MLEVQDSMNDDPEACAMFLANAEKGYSAIDFARALAAAETCRDLLPEILQTYLIDSFREFRRAIRTVDISK